MGAKRKIEIRKVSRFGTLDYTAFGTSICLSYNTGRE